MSGHGNPSRLQAVVLPLAPPHSGGRTMVSHGLTVLLLASLLQTAFPLSSPYSGSFGQIQRIVGKPPQKPAPSAKEKARSQTDAAEEVNSVPSPDDETVDAFIRSEYAAWTIANNKTSSEDRFEIFKANFLETLKKYESTGQYHALNKYADMTPDEFKKVPAPVDEVDVYVRSEYKTWLEQYGKTGDDKRYAVFKDNFLMTMKIFEETGKFNALNEHGDMTREEFLRMQTKLAISSKSPTGGSGMSGQESGGNPYSTIPSQSAAQASYPSYPRSSAMTFIPVSPGTQSDILNRGSSSGGGGGGDWGATSGGGGGDWGAMSGGGGGDWGGGGWGAPSYSPSVQPPAPAPPVSYPRPSSMTFTPVTSSPASDILNKGSSSSSNTWGGQEWSSPMVGPPTASPSNAWGPQETSSPMVGPPVSSAGSAWGDPAWSSPRGGPPPARAPPPDPYSSYEFSRPSSMTFTPVTMRSQSDVLNNGSSSNRNDDWSGQDWGFTGGRSKNPSPPPAQPYSPSNPSGVTFKSITPNSNSDLLNRGGSEHGGRPLQSTSSSYTSFPDKKGKGTFSYMPKSGGPPSDGRSNYDNGSSSQFGKSSSGTFTNSPGGVQSNSSSRGDPKNDSLWNKMASAVEALAGGSKPSSYSSLNNNLSGNPKSDGTSKGNRSSL